MRNPSGHIKPQVGLNNMTKEEAIKKSESINGLTSLVEKEAIWDLSMQYIPEGGLAIEIGTWCGGSAVIIGEVCKQKNARLICIDAFSSDMHEVGDVVHYEAFKTVIDNCYGLPIDYMCGDSQYFVNYIKPEIADFMFIDGVHKLPTVETDIVGFWKALKFGGCYLMHDYGNPCDVKQVVDKVFRQEQLVRVDSAVYVIK